MIYLDNNTFQQEIFIPRSSVKNDASPEYATKNELENAIENEVIRADEKYAAKTDLLPYATTGWVESQGYLTEHQDISGKLDISDFTAYTANTQTELNNKQDASAMTAYYTSAQTDTAIQNATNGLASEEWVESQGYLTGYTETDPVFQASAASGITSQDITNWNAKLDSSDLEPYYTSAQTNNAISVAVSGKADSSAVTAQISAVKQEIEAEIPTKVSSLENDLNFVNSGDVKTQIDNATSGKQDTLVSGVNIKTINNQSLLGSGNIEIQGGGSGGGSYTAGANIDITNNVISVTGITAPTKTSDLANDSGFINSEQAQTQINSSVSGKVDTSVFATYTANTKTEIDDAVSLKADSSRVDEIEEVTASALVELHSTKQDILVSGTNIKTINNQSLLGSGNIEIQGGSGGGSNIIELTQAEYDALTAYTEDAIYVITDSQAINMDNYVTTGALGSYYTSAQTNTAISNAVSGKTDKVSVTASSGGYKFPTWNNQGCITGTNGTAYQASQSINGSNRYLYSNSSSSLPTIYAPTSAGSAGQPLLSNGSGAPVWASYKFQFISQSQYDALATKDSTTIYFIVNEN